MHYEVLLVYVSLRL